MNIFEDWAFECISKDSVIIASPCLISAIILSSDGTSASSCDIYDSRGTKVNKILTLRAPANQSAIVLSAFPIRCNNGIYIDVGSNVECVTVFYKAVYSEKEIKD